MFSELLRRCDPVFRPESQSLDEDAYQTCLFKPFLGLDLVRLTVRTPHSPSQLGLETGRRAGGRSEILRKK
ncbi:MAG: hypothetical protein CMJ81_00225 [Planctomycetaceae bacterium]|nr:hypothetical protein [Planctomycetaceae bacterium]MBP60361.1 hypothetical protein [Planctomycetaceae bacterium]